jgi:hypothetical protein
VDPLKKNQAGKGRKTLKNKSQKSMSFKQHHRTPVVKLGDCIPGDRISINGARGEVSFMMPHFGSDSYFKNGPIWVMVRLHKGTCCPHPYLASLTNFKIEEFYGASS